MIVITWGDSLTYGVGSSNDLGYPELLRAMGFDVVKKGYPGQASSDIALRQGGLSPILTTSILSPGTYKVVSMEPSGDFRKYKDISFEGRLEGKPVTLIRSTDGQWTIKSSSNINCENGCRFVSRELTYAQGATNIIWVGRNNNLAFPRFVERDVDLMITSLPEGNRFIVIGLTPSVSDSQENINSIRAINSRLKERYGSRFIDMWSLLNSEGLKISGLDPTVEDDAAVLNGMIPLSLYSDGLHFNDHGYKAIALIINRYL